MSANTSIEWTDATFNPWWGCQKVSPACDHCYASVIAGEGSGMQRDHAWHSARYLEEVDSPADIGRLAGERAGGAGN